MDKNKAKAAALPVSQDQIDAWKKQHGDVYHTQVQNGNRVLNAFLKPPTRAVMALALSKQAANLMLEAGQVLLDNCKLHLDEEIEQDDKCYVAVAMQAFNLFDLPTATTKKL